MSAKLYHTEVGLPEDLLKPLLGRAYKLSYSRHAINEMLSDRYGAPKKMPTKVWLERAEVFETEITDGWVSKICIRVGKYVGVVDGDYQFIAARATLDLILVLVPDRGGLFVKTLWFNDSTDKHATLDRSKYATL